jgi:arsenate reductase-like glutaredoxin family protein
MSKKITVYIDPKDKVSDELLSFLSEHELFFKVHDISEKPLTENQISRLVCHFNLDHFLNTESKAFKKNKLDTSLPDRSDVVRLMAEENNLLKTPIVTTNRLLTVGFNRQALIDMLELRTNGDDPLAKADGEKEVSEKSRSKSKVAQ